MTDKNLIDMDMEEFIIILETKGIVSFSISLDKTEYWLNEKKLLCSKYRAEECYVEDTNNEIFTTYMIEHLYLHRAIFSIRKDYTELSDFTEVQRALLNIMACSKLHIQHKYIDLKPCLCLVTDTKRKQLLVEKYGDKAVNESIQVMYKEGYLRIKTYDAIFLPKDFCFEDIPKLT